MREIRGQNIIITLCVTITITFYVLFIKYINTVFQVNSELGITILAIITSTGVFHLCFKIIFWIYTRYIEHIIFSKENIIGEWFYKLEIHDNPNSDRYGICKIEKHNGELLASGIHYDPKEVKLTSLFTTDYAIIDKDRLLINYSSTGIDGDVFTRKGIFYLNTEGTPPKRIFGIWTDVLQGSNRGKIFLQRKNDETDAILKEIGYSFGSDQLRNILQLK